MSIDLVAAARQLPTDVDRDDCGEDERATKVSIEGRSWSACGLADASLFNEFLAAVQDEVASTEMTKWTPVALVEHAPGGRCAVVKSSTLPASQTAAVYPHVVNTFPPGEFPCPWATR